MKICATRMGAAVLMVASVTDPGMADSLEDWLTGDHATGDWGGIRTTLEDAGVTFEGAYTTDILGVRNGNAGSGDGWDYAGRVDFGVAFDLDKLAGLPGLSLFASGAWSSGQDLSERKVGNVFAVQQIFTGREIRLSQLYLQQELWDDRLSFKIGRLTTEEDFLASDIYTNYVNGGINGVPSNVPGGNFGFTTAPFAQWGLVGAVEPIEGLRFAIGVYNADERTIDDRRNGTRFTLDPEDGVFAIGEVSYGWNQAVERDDEGERNPTERLPGTYDPKDAGTESGESKASHGLPGLAKLGIFGESGNREDLKDGRDKDGNAGFYVSLQQMVYREEGTQDLGLTPWAVATFLPRESINGLPVFFGAGLVYKGLIPTREDDNTAVGFFYGKLSKDLDPGGSEKVLEINHTAQLTPWFYVRPDLQLVFDPAGVNSADTAVVFGGEIGITF
jgi:porin